jgi:hypothetical protein
MHFTSASDISSSEHLMFKLGLAMALSNENLISDDSFFLSFRINSITSKIISSFSFAGSK